MLPWACSHMARNRNWWNSRTKTCEQWNRARRPIAFEFLLPFFNSSITETSVKYYPLLLRFHLILTCQSQMHSLPFIWFLLSLLISVAPVLHPVEEISVKETSASTTVCLSGIISFFYSFSLSSLPLEISVVNHGWREIAVRSNNTMHQCYRVIVAINWQHFFYNHYLTTLLAIGRLAITNSHYY
jgi:hypothetical protein